MAKLVFVTLPGGRKRVPGVGLETLEEVEAAKIIGGYPQDPPTKPGYLSIVPCTTWIATKARYLAVTRIAGTG